MKNMRYKINDVISLQDEILKYITSKYDYIDVQLSDLNKEFSNFGDYHMTQFKSIRERLTDIKDNKLFDIISSIDSYDKESRRRDHKLRKDLLPFIIELQNKNTIHVEMVLVL